MNPMWLLRAKRWAQNPPPLSRILLVFGIIAVCGALYAIETIWGWPDALTVEKIRR
jgi:hypothetical protein